MFRRSRVVLSLLVLVCLGYWGFYAVSGPPGAGPPIDTVSTFPIPGDSSPHLDSTGSRIDTLPPSRVALKTVDKLIRALDTASIAFAAPDTLPLLRVGVVQLILSSIADTAGVRGLMRAPAAAGTAVVLAGNRMQAALTGGAFRIVPVRPEVQAVSLAASTEWLWDVTPTEPGPHTLHLTLSVILPVEGHDAYFALKTFDRNLVVEVSFGRRLLAFLGSEWKWLWTALLVPIVAWLWRRRKKPAVPPAGAA